MIRVHSRAHENRCVPEDINKEEDRFSPRQLERAGYNKDYDLAYRDLFSKRIPIRFYCFLGFGANSGKRVHGCTQLTSERG
jgi:hypothetical protein